MNSIIHITVQTLLDAEQGKNGLEVVGNAYKKHGKEGVLHLGAEVHACIMERGMTNGKTSLMFALIDIEGKAHMFEMSNDNLQMLAGAAKGADERFKDEERKKARDN